MKKRVAHPTQIVENDFTPQCCKVWLKWKAIHMGSPSFWHSLRLYISTCSIDNEQQKSRTISQVSRVTFGQTPFRMVCAMSPALSLGTDAHHTSFEGNSNRCGEHHFPELSLLNMVQIIGYVYMHNAFEKHLLYTQILLHATHSVTQVVKMLS